MAAALDGVERVTRVDVADQPSVLLFKVDRRGRSAAWVAWERRDAFTGEDAAALAVELNPDVKISRAEDAFGQTVPIQTVNGHARISVTDTPVFLQ
jgi:hypothetical protein